MSLARVRFKQYELQVHMNEQNVSYFTAKEIGEKTGVVLGVVTKPHHDIYQDPIRGASFSPVQTQKTWLVIGCDDKSIHECLLEHATYMGPDK